MQWHMQSLITVIIIYFLAEANVALKKGGLIEYNKVASTKYNELPLSEKKLSEEMIVEPRGERWKGIFWLIFKNMWEIFLHVISYLHMFPML